MPANQKRTERSDGFFGGVLGFGKVGSNPSNSARVDGGGVVRDASGISGVKFAASGQVKVQTPQWIGAVASARVGVVSLDLGQTEWRGANKAMRNQGSMNTFRNKCHATSPPPQGQTLTMSDIPAG